MKKRSLPYSKIYQHEWREFRQLIPSIGHSGILVYLYLRTSPHINLAGLGEVPATYINRDTSLDLKTIENALCDLSDAGFILYDYATEEILVIDMVKVQTDTALNPRDNRCGAIYRFVMEELFSDTIRDYFIDKYSGTHFFYSYEIAEANEAPLIAPSQASSSSCNSNSNISRDVPDGTGTAMVDSNDYVATMMQ